MSDNAQSSGSGASVFERLKALGVPEGKDRQSPQKKSKPTGGNSPAATSPMSAFKINPALSFKVLKPEDRTAMLEGLAEFKKAIPAVMNGLVAFKRDVEHLAPEEKLGYKTQLDEVNREIAHYLNRPGIAGVTAKIVYADALVRTCPEEKRAVIETADELLRIHFTEEVGPQRKGVLVYTRSFVPDSDLAKIPGVTEVMVALAGLVDRTRAAGKKFFQENLEELKRQEGDNLLTVEEITSGTEGRRVLSIPDQNVTTRGGESRFYKGGFALVEVSDGEISIINALGGVGRLMDRFAGLSLPVEFLANEEFKPKERINDSSEFGNLRLLHRLLRLGLAEGRKEEEKAENKEAFKAQVGAEREVLMAKATLTQAQAHIGQLPGRFLQEWGPRFDQKTGRKDNKGQPIVRAIWYPMSLIERNADGLIRVVETPERLKEFFAPHMSFAAPGEDYSNLGKLGVLLRRDKARAEVGTTPEEKKAAARAKADADAAKAAAKTKAATNAATQLAAELAAGSGEDITGAVIPPIPSAQESGEEPRGLKKTPKTKRAGK